MNDVIEQLERSVGIVKNWGRAQLPNNRTLAEQLTFDGLSLWDAMAPVMALYYVPVALSGQRFPSLAQRLRPHISLAKRRVLNHIKRWQSIPVHDEVAPLKKAFLFMGFSGYMYRDVLEPVATYLVRTRGQKIFALHDVRSTCDAHVSMDSAQTRSVWQYWSRDVKSDAHVLGQQVAAAIAELRATSAFSRLIQADGESLCPHMENAFNWLFHFHIPLLVPQAAIARNILKQHQPRLIIGADVADPRARLYSLLGHHMRIPSLEVQFGPNGAEGVEWNFLLADRVATWGATTRQALLEHGVSAQRIAITGSPRHDSLVNVCADEVAKTRERLGIPAGFAMVLCASTYQQKEYNSLSDPELLLSMKRAVFKAAAQLSGLCLVVKPHPLENVRETKQLIGVGRNIVLVDSADDIRELTKACDAFLGFGSTATMDAMIARKPTICPAFPGWIWSDIFLNSDAVLVPRTEEDVVVSLRKIVDGSIGQVMAELEPARQEFLQQLAYKVDGHAAERTAAMAMEMAGSSFQ